MNREDINRKMFERWNKVRRIMTDEEIVIAEVITPEEEKKLMPDLIKEDISIMKHSDPELYPNYFMWSEYHDDSEGWRMVDAAPNYKDLINLDANIKWINTELLEKLEKLHNLNNTKGDVSMDYTENCKKALETWQSGVYHDPCDFIGSLDEDTFVGVGREIFQFLNKENSTQQIRKVYGKTCENCTHDGRYKCYTYEHRENCLNDELAYTWLKWLSDLPKEYKKLASKHLPNYSDEGIQCITLNELEEDKEYFVDMEEIERMFGNWKIFGCNVVMSRVYGDAHNYIWVWLDDESEPDYNPYRDLFFFIVPSIRNEDKETFQKIYRLFVDILKEPIEETASRTAIKGE